MPETKETCRIQFISREQVLNLMWDTSWKYSTLAYNLEKNAKLTLDFGWSTNVHISEAF